MTNSKHTFKYHISPGIGPLWAHGFRTVKPDSIKSADTWRQIVTFIILKTFGDIPAGRATQEAEKGLGIESSFYWFLGSSKHYYGNGIFLCQVMNADWNDKEKGLSPFDSGGIWYQKTKTIPVSLLDSASGRKAFFDKYNYFLNGWLGIFSNYTQNNYHAFEDYVYGKLPDKNDGISEIIKAYRLVGKDKTTEQDSLAWTWEGRVKKGWNDDQIKWTLFLCYEEQLKVYKDWLMRSRAFLPSEKKRILVWLKDKCKPCDKKQSPIIWAQQIILATGI